MPIPIPDYLKRISFYEEIIDKTQILMNIKCVCGNTFFQVFKNKESKNTNAEYDEWNKKREAYWSSFSCKSYSTSAFVNKADGLIYEQGHTLSGNHFGAFCISDKPKYASRTIFKIICSECGVEYIIYDNSKYGYNGCICSEETRYESEPKYYQIKRKSFIDNLLELKILIENNETYEDFIKSTDDNYSFDKYSNSFSWITIYAYSNGRKHKIYEEETS